jgi:formate dehydrogenase major subunit
MMITLTINDKRVEVPEGTTVLEAARANQINIPTLCDHPAIKPYGGCRLCVVEVQGARLPQASCTLPAAEGMVVKTDTPALRAGRKFVLTMLFSERNHFCPFCQLSGGDCELQNAAYREGMTHWEFQPNWTPFPVDASHPDFVIDNNRCILCRRCVRVCDELVGNATLGIEERGTASLLVADTGLPLGQSSCISCGMCVQVCPTGAIIDRYSAYQGQDRQVTRTASICIECSMGCAIEVVTRDNRLVRIDGDWNGAINGGLVCEAGRYAPLKETRTRLTSPLIRREGRLQSVTWNEALSAIASRLQPTVGQPHTGVAAIASTRLPVEALSAFKHLFAEALGGDMVTSLDENNTNTSTNETGPLIALQEADCILMLGANLARSHQVAGFFIKRRVRAGANLILVEPGESEWDRFATLLVQQNDTADATLQRLIKTIQNLQNPDTHVDTELTDAAVMLFAAKRPALVYSSDTTTQTIELLRELATLLNAELIGVTGSANSLAAAQLKLDKRFNLNGHQAVYVALGDDKIPDGLMQQLSNVPFIAVQASYRSELTEQANVVLPVEMWAEQEGHYLNLDGHLQETHRALTPPEGVKANVAVLNELAQYLNVEVVADWESELTNRTPAMAAS